MSEEMFGAPQSGASSGGLNMNSDIAKQMSLLSAAGRLRATSAGGPPQMMPTMRTGMAPPVPPNVPGGDKARAQFLGMLSQVLAQRGTALAPFITGQPNPAYNPDVGPLKGIQPASDNRIGVLRLPGAVPGRTGDVDLFKLWGAVTGAGGMQRIQAGGQWENVANHIGYQPSPGFPGQLAQLYFLILGPLEDHMKRSAQAKQAQMLAQQQQQQQQNLTPAQLHQQQSMGVQNPAMVNPALGMQNPSLGMQNPMQNNMGGPGLGMQNPTLGATGLGGMQNPAMGGMQNPTAALGGMQNPSAALGGMQNPAALGSIQNPTLGGVMQNNLTGGVMQNNLSGLGGMQMTPAQLHQQNQQPSLTPAQMHAMQNPTANGSNPALGMANPALGMANPALGMANPTLGMGAGGSAMPPPAPIPELGGKRKSEPDDDEKRAKLKVGDPPPVTTTPRRTKIEYVPLRLDVETWGGRALDGMMAGVGAQGSMERNVRDISELGTVDITSIILSLRSRTPRALGYALGSLSILSSHIQQSFPLVRCEDLLDVLVELLESAALDGDGWMGGPLGSEREAIQSRIKQEENFVNRQDGAEETWDEQDEEIPIRTHRELVRIAAEMGVDSIYGDIAPPGLARSDVIITILRLLRNFSIGPENCQFMTRDGSRVVDALASIVGFREDTDRQPEGLFSWDAGVDVHISPLSSSLNLSQLLRVRKDVLHIIANLGMHVRLHASNSTPQRLFQLMASFLLDPADTRSPVQLYQHLLPNRRFSLTTEIALDALSRLAHADANRAVFQRTVSPVLLKAVFMALTKMLPAEPNDMILLIRSEMWMAYAERISLALYALSCSLPSPTRATIRIQHRQLGASILRMMCRMAQYDPNPDKSTAPWAQRSPFTCLVRRVVEALRVIDEPEEEVQVGWPVRGGKLEGGQASGWLAGVGAEDALLMMTIEGMDTVLFEDLEVLTRMGEVGA
ncbi:ARID/bright DNA-binding domain protein [Rhizoctonia solani 123E]|uniref:ARID/bright DNA-binding domain protein n=1 Tax=Rhizoctonia solani 123E TaxID=1423351 RepID=A0A074RKB5_9AGAM|nr:ARID/bright DNA-binding domain protein [Rhizoctonia solani 123E]